MSLVDDESGESMEPMEEIPLAPTDFDARHGDAAVTDIRVSFCTYNANCTRYRAVVRTGRSTAASGRHQRRCSRPRRAAAAAAADRRPALSGTTSHTTTVNRRRRSPAVAKHSCFSSARLTTSLCSVTTYADNVALPAFAHSCCAPVAIDRYLLPAGPRQQ